MLPLECLSIVSLSKILYRTALSFQIRNKLFIFHIKLNIIFVFFFYYNLILYSIPKVFLANNDIESVLLEKIKLFENRIVN
jgi:hypothetical protein